MNKLGFPEDTSLPLRLEGWAMEFLVNNNGNFLGRWDGGRGGHGQGIERCHEPRSRQRIRATVCFTS